MRSSALLHINGHLLAMPFFFAGYLGSNLLMQRRIQSV